MTVNVCPPTVIVPVRGLVAGFAAILNVTVPLPDPLAPPVIVIQLTLLDVVQAQPVPAVIENDPLPPAAGAESDAGDIAYEHEVEAGCVIDTIWPAIMIVPVRDAVPVFGATPNVTDPLPDPLVGGVIVTHVAVL